MYLPDFKLVFNNGLSEELRKTGIYTFHEAICFIAGLPYKRNLLKHDLFCIFQEKCGTCSTKHAFLCQIALENERKDIRLMLGIYKMNGENTKGTGKILLQNNLTYLPEAHNYIMYRQQRFDFTFGLSQTGKSYVFDSLDMEVPISPKQISDFKEQFHKDYLQKWLLHENLAYSLTEIWAIREACIAALSN